MGRSAHYSSPSSKLRDQRRLSKFLTRKLSCRKPVKLMMSRLASIDMMPTSNLQELSISLTNSISIPSRPKSKCLSIIRLASFNSCPANQTHDYHPHIIEACRLMYGKKPDQLTSDEEEHFEGYQEWKNEKGEPIEEDFIFKPA